MYASIIHAVSEYGAVLYGTVRHTKHTLVWARTCGIAIAIAWCATDYSDMVR